MGIQYLSTGRSYIHQKTTKKRATVAHTYKYTKLTLPHKLRLLPGTRWHLTRSNGAQRQARGKCHKNVLVQRSCFFHICFFVFFLSSPTVTCLVTTSTPPSRPLYWYFSAFSRSPLSPIAATVGFELSHFSLLHFSFICCHNLHMANAFPYHYARQKQSKPIKCKAYVYLKWYICRSLHVWSWVCVSGCVYLNLSQIDSRIKSGLLFLSTLRVRGRNIPDKYEYYFRF